MRSAMLRTLHAKVREGGRGTWDHLLLGLVYVRWVFQNRVRLWYSCEVCGSCVAWWAVEEKRKRKKLSPV